MSTVLWALGMFAVGTLAHASLRSPNLKARLSSYRESSGRCGYSGRDCQYSSRVNHPCSQSGNGLPGSRLPELRVSRTRTGLRAPVETRAGKTHARKTDPTANRGIEGCLRESPE